MPKKIQAIKLNNMFDKGDVDEGSEYFTKFMIKHIDSEEERDKLYKLFSGNYNGLMPYKLRNIQLPDRPESFEYRTMGIMEPTVCNLVTLRMKVRKMNWLLKGAKLLTLRSGGKLYEVLDTLYTDIANDDQLAKMVEKVVQMSAAQVNKKSKYSDYYSIKGALCQDMTKRRKTIRNLVENRVASELVLR